MINLFFMFFFTFANERNHTNTTLIGKLHVCFQSNLYVSFLDAIIY